MSLRTFLGRTTDHSRRHNLILHLQALSIAAVPVEKLRADPKLRPLQGETRNAFSRVARLRVWAAGKTAKNGQHGEFFEIFSNFFRIFFFFKSQKKVFFGRFGPFLDDFWPFFGPFGSFFEHFENPARYGAAGSFPGKLERKSVKCAQLCINSTPRQFKPVKSIRNHTGNQILRLRGHFGASPPPKRPQNDPKVTPK